MDELINIFVESNFTQETQEDIFQSLGLFRVFNYLEPFPVIEQILMTGSLQETTAMVDGFINVITAAQDYLLDRHGITLSSETTLAFNNVVLKVLFQLQRLQDPEPVLKTLETMNDDMEKITEIFAMFSEVPQTTFLQIVETVRPICLVMLSDFLYTQESNMQLASSPLPRIKEMVHLFKDVYGIPLPVRAVLDSDTVMGETFNLYLPLYDELREQVADEELLVQSLLFLLLYSSDGVMDPMKTFSIHADYLVSDLTVGNRLERVLGEMYNKLLRHKEMKSHEKA